MLMYVDTANGYKYRSLRRVYRRTRNIESISLFLSLATSHYFTPQLRPLLRDLQQVKLKLRRVTICDGITKQGSDS